MRRSRRKQVQNKQLVFMFFGVLICLFGLTIGYAALSSTLNISGSTTVMGAKWDSTVEVVDSSTVSSILNLSEDAVFVENYAVVGTASLVKKPVISDNSITDLQVSVTKPNDTIDLLYKFTNSGDVAMQYDSVEVSTPVITSSSNNSADVTWANNYFNYEVNIFINSGGTNIDLVSGDVVCPGETVYIGLSAGISDAASLPSASLTVSNLNAKFNFSQYNGTKCSS